MARLHQLEKSRVLHALQNPAVVDQGVFHNDVIAVGNREVLLYHAQAFHDTAAVREWAQAGLGGKAALLEISEREVSVDEAVASYLFNSQLVCPPGAGMQLVVAQECEENARVWACIQRLIADPANPISGVRVFDLRQSMHNGGGPACLRLRVVLTEAQRAAVNASSWISGERYTQLSDWVRQHYRERLDAADLADPALLDESRTALDRLTQLLGLGSIYDFQR